jgi:hypothetical protein
MVFTPYGNFKGRALSEIDYWAEAGKELALSDKMGVITVSTVHGLTHPTLFMAVIKRGKDVRESADSAKAFGIQTDEICETSFKLPQAQTDLLCQFVYPYLSIRLPY